MYYIREYVLGARCVRRCKRNATCSVDAEYMFSARLRYVAIMRLQVKSTEALVMVPRPSLRQYESSKRWVQEKTTTALP